MGQISQTLTSILTTDLIPSVLQNEFNSTLPKALSEHMNPAKQLLLACEIFTSKLEIIKSEQQYFGNYSYRSRKNKGVKATNAELYLYGARLVYAIRMFLTQEEILFHIGVKGADGMYAKDAFIKQQEVMQNLTANSRHKYIQLSAAIQKELIDQANQDTITDVVFTNKWKLIEELANVKGEGTLIGTEKVVEYSDGKAVKAWRKQKEDFKVYATFKGVTGSTKPQIRSKYYDLNNNLVSFNNGWLWEWYDSIYNSGDDEKIANVHAAIDGGDLTPLFLNEKDSVPGIKQGDYMNSMNQQVQNKYGNTKIITYNNILAILYELTPALRNYVTEGESAETTQKLLKVLKTHFIPEAALGVSDSAEKKIEAELLAMLRGTSV